MMDILSFIEQGWSHELILENEDATDPAIRCILTYPDGTMRFAHVCDRKERGMINCAPALQLEAGHRIVQLDPLTIEPSILCPDCGTHGFVRAGRWQSC